VRRDLDDLHPPHDTFPGEVLFELAVDALDMSGGQTNRVEKLVVDSRPGGP
jgi:hypothetical protein